MKLNPPETAPKNGSVFIAKFGGHERLWLTFRNSRNDGWIVAMKTETGFTSAYSDDEFLSGWLPMPAIDDEGNVI